MKIWKWTLALVAGAAYGTISVSCYVAGDLVKGTAYAVLALKQVASMWSG